MQRWKKLLRGTVVYSYVFCEDVVVRIGLQGVFALFIRAHGKNSGIGVFDISVEGYEFIATAVDFKRKGFAYDKSYSSFDFVDLSYNFSHTESISFFQISKRKGSCTGGLCAEKRGAVLRFCSLIYTI